MRAFLFVVFAVLFPGAAADALSTITQVTPRNAPFLGDVLHVTFSVEANGDVDFSVCIPDKAGHVKVGFVIWDKPVPVSDNHEVDRWPHEGLQKQASCRVEGRPKKHARCYEVRVSGEVASRSTIWLSRVAGLFAFDAWEIVLGEFVRNTSAK